MWVLTEVTPRLKENPYIFKLHRLNTKTNIHRPTKWGGAEWPFLLLPYLFDAPPKHIQKVLIKQDD
jgi:hypothetical protein